MAFLRLETPLNEEDHIDDLCARVLPGRFSSACEIKSMHAVRLDDLFIVPIEVRDLLQRFLPEGRRSESLLEISVERRDAPEDPEHDLRDEDIGGALREGRPELTGGLPES